MNVTPRPAFPGLPGTPHFTATVYVASELTDGLHMFQMPGGVKDDRRIEEEHATKRKSASSLSK